MAKRKSATAGPIALPERCGVAVARELVAAAQALDPGAPFRIGAGAVARMSAATVISLISIARTIGPEGGKVVIHGPSAAFTDAFADLGLFESLMNMEFAE